MAEKKYIASLDVGTTTIRCFIFDSKCQIIGSASELVELLNTQPGFFEIEPEQLWQSILNVIKNSIRDARLSPSDITGLGLSTQRCSFISWDKKTDEYFHNFITWKDLRADNLVKKWNSSFTIKMINTVSYLLYLVSRSKRFLAGSVLTMMNSQVTLRLLWQMENNTRLKEAITNKTAAFGTLDTWLLYKLRKGLENTSEIEQISDITSATATGFFDPFTRTWAKWAFTFFSIKSEILPKVVDNAYNFGYVHKSLFGNKIKISSSLSDQSAAMWGSCCFNEGDVKVTLGTGSFLNLNTGKQCHASVYGLYPLVAWQFNSQNKNNNDKLVYCVEGAANDTGTIINWGLNFGLYDDPAKTSDIAESVQDTDGVFFVPAFSGLGPPINDHKAASGFLGIRPSTRKAHMVRAILESITFRVAQLYQCTKSETDYKLTCIRIDGGVSKNNFICQLIADVTGLKVERAVNSEASVVGSCFVAGLKEGIWNNKEDLLQFRIIDKIFMPRPEMKLKCSEKLKEWETAIHRFKGWYI